MTPHKCLVKNGAEGDCLRACIATILDWEDASSIPNFAEGAINSEGFQGAINEWLKTVGLSLFYCHLMGLDSLGEVIEALNQTCPDTPTIVIGKSSNGADHAVVVIRGELFNDPSGAGIVGPCDDGSFVTCCLAVGKNYRDHVHR